MKMKHELRTTDNKSSSPVLPAAARARTISRRKVSPAADSANAAASSGPETRPKPAAPVHPSSSTNMARKALQFSKPKPATVHNARTVEHHAWHLPRRADANCKGSGGGEEDGAKVKELQSRLDESERSLRESQREVLALQAEMEKLRVLNAELKSQKKKLEDDLSAAEAKIKTLEKNVQVDSITRSGFGDELELVQKKLQNSRERGDDISKLQSIILKPSIKAVEIQTKSLIKKPSPPLLASKAPVSGPPPPPPPPPPPQHTQGRTKTVHKASAVVELYHSLTKRDRKQGPMINGGCASPLSGNPHISIVGELQNRSAHLLAIKSDVETKGNLIKHLIEKVRLASFSKMEDALSFVDWLDGELSTLADERAVLKHFDWPEKKADALREAAFEFRDVRKLEDEVSSFKDDASLPCDASLKKISSLLDKLERSVSRLIKLRTTSMVLFKECKIPTDWMLDSGMPSKMKQVSVKLAKVYMRRVSMELESARHSERESAQEALLFEGVRFAYRAHQFAGGLDSETMFIFEELKTRVESHDRGH
ncbi:protein CHUP1, chloroplastic isoform X2 [Canna indica]|uniref:Protein CHUP1, chloroplastic isoform X2 n=1 Tax=Canna indica TaxID=4628 RepID=A0AAQ3QP82_9LILI|nr:protein CHUP1, chloroplastic isoform X2 [Canna indica]